MYRLIECLTQEHRPVLLAAAVLVCLFGAILSTQMMRRILRAEGRRRALPVALAGVIAGATVWSTHFLAMLAYDPGYPHGFGPVLTGLSLAVAIGGLIGAVALLGLARKPLNYLGGGVAFGLTIAAMHYLGMSAYRLPGRIVWDPGTVALSVLLGAGLGTAAFHRVAVPVTRLCWLACAALMMLAICAMHFTGMIAFQIELSPLVDVPHSVIPDGWLAVFVAVVTAILLVMGFVGQTIEAGLEREARRRIEETATHDALTGLPNRLGLHRALGEMDDRMQGDERLKVAVLSVGLMDLKSINHLHGHAAGDGALMEIAGRLQAAVSRDGCVARCGGNEFVIVWTGFRRIEEVRALAERLRALVVEPVTFGEVELTTRCAVGAASSIEDSGDVRELLTRADRARHRAKAVAAPDICLFNAEMEQQNLGRLQMIADLRLALARNEFELVYQLQNETGSREPRGFEALLRWNHPTRGRVSPADFIPLAEETGLIREIGLWVLKTACHEAASWDRPLMVAVNVAPPQLAQPSFIEHLQQILAESGLAPERLELEITEASIIDDQDHVLQVMYRIKSMGVHIAMDDFGTGYSSLATLQAFPFDKIKIDRSFVHDVHLDRQRAAIVRSTLLLGDALGIPVLAEGVEYESELDFLQAERCDYVQGFLFGRPMSVEEARQMASAPQDSSRMAS